MADVVDSLSTIIRRYALTIAGIVGLAVVLFRYVTTGAFEMPVFSTFAGLLGFQSLQNGRADS